MQERFPPLQYGVLIVSYYSSNQFLAHALVESGRPMQYDLGSLLGAVTLLCIFFHVRVFDEHKDFEDDCRHFSGRVLQRGVVSLRELKYLAAVAIGLELLLSACWTPAGKPAALTATVIVLAFSLLMFEEFFARQWLRRHFLVYAVSHMLLMPLLAMVVFGFAVGRYPWEAPRWYWLYAAVGFFVAFNWEISRKIRAPEEEIDGVDSYTSVFGTFGAAYAVLAVRVVDTALVALVGWHLGLSVWFYVVLIALFGVCMIGFLQYRFNVTPKTARRMETYAGMYVVAFDLLLVVELGRTYGIQFAGWS